MTRDVNNTPLLSRVTLINHITSSRYREDLTHRKYRKMELQDREMELQDEDVTHHIDEKKHHCKTKITMADEWFIMDLQYTILFIKLF